MSAPGGVSRSRWGRLFWRVQGFGLVLLLAVTVMTSLAVRALWNLGERPSSPPSKLMARYLAEGLAQSWGEPSAREVELERIRSVTRMPVRLIEPPLSNEVVDAPQPPAAPGATKIALAQVVLQGQPVATLELKFGPPPARNGMGLPLLVGLAVLTLLSILGARALASPVERLTDAARRFGEGDTTARARLARSDELGELARAFDTMADRLTALRRGEKELLANVSHELRTPLARIGLALELARERADSGVAPYLDEVGESARELEALVADLVVVARLDLGEQLPGPGIAAVNREAIPLELVVEEAARDFRQAHPSHPFEVEQGGQRPVVQLDRALCLRALRNLLENAHRHGGPGTVTLRVAGESPALRIEVQDRGAGISPEDQARLFTPFFRTDASRNRATGGVGLGLHLARRIAEVHGGTVDVVSTPGQGACFRFHLSA